jgi:hypothetical protein
LAANRARLLPDTVGSSPWTLGAYLSTRVPQPAITSHLSSVAGGGVDPGVGNYTAPVTDAFFGEFA